MYLTNEPTFYVFEMTNDEFEAIGEVTQVTSVMWAEASNGCAEFELWAAYTSDMAELLKTGNVVWLDGDDVGGLIEHVRPTFDDDGNGTINVKGRTLECLLERRAVNGTWKRTNKSVSTIMRDMVADHAITPTNDKRIIPYLALEENDPLVGGVVSSYQKTGDDVYTALCKLAENYSLSWSLAFIPSSTSLELRIREGIDRSLDSDGSNGYVVFSTDMGDLLSSEYEKSVKDFKTVANVYGEAESGSRSYVTVGDDNGNGLNRYELYVDARDLQSEVYDEDGTSHTLSEAEYLDMLKERGLEKLADCVVQESFNASVRPLQDSSFKYGEDYIVGDVVTFQDDRIGVTVDARVEQVQAEYGEDYSLSVTVGYETPTVMQRLRRMTAN